MIGGTSNNKSYSLYTGLTPVKVITCNPTTEQYKEITGLDRQMNNNILDFSGTKYRKLSFLCHSEELGYRMLDILISKELVTSREGKKRFIDALGNCTHYAVNKEAITSNSKMSWIQEPLREMRKGEDSLYELLKALVSYNSRSEGAQWEKDMTDNGYDFDKFMDGDVSMINKVLEHAKDRMVTVMACVKTVTKDNETKSYQEIYSESSLFFSYNGSISDYAKSMTAKFLDSQNVKRDCSVDFTKYVASEQPVVENKVPF